jgi:hypothetical protein
MTILSEIAAPKICQYCGNSDGRYCLADVPYYAVSIFCDNYRESSIGEPERIVRPAGNKALMQRCFKALVETF